MLFVDEFPLGKLVFECKVEHSSSPEVSIFYSASRRFYLSLLALKVCVMSVSWLRVVYVTSPALGSV